jgi:hypothetical protein
MSSILEELPVILIWVAIWGLFDLAIQAFVPDCTAHKAITYLFILGVAVFIDVRTPGGYI